MSVYDEDGRFKSWATVYFVIAAVFGIVGVVLFFNEEKRAVGIVSILGGVGLTVGGFYEQNKEE